MKKSELKSGMIITTRNGKEYVVFTNTCFFGNDVAVSFKDNCWLNLSNDFYDDNLKNMFDDVEKCQENDIVKVEKPQHPLYVVPSVEKRFKEELQPFSSQKEIVWMPDDELKKEGC